MRLAGSRCRRDQGVALRLLVPTLACDTNTLAGRLVVTACPVSLSRRRQFPPRAVGLRIRVTALERVCSPSP